MRKKFILVADPVIKEKLVFKSVHVSLDELIKHADDAINSNPQNIIINIESFYNGDQINGMLWNAAKNLLLDGVSLVIVTGDSDSAKVNAFYKEFVKFRAFYLHEDVLRNIQFIKISELKNITVTERAVNLTNTSLENKNIDNLFLSDSGKHTGTDYDITKKSGFLLWLHYFHEFDIDCFQYDYAKLLWLNKISLASYNMYFDYKMDELDDMLKAEYARKKALVQNGPLADLHTHPTVGMRYRHIMENILKISDNDWKKVNLEFHSSLQKLGYSTIQDIARNFDLIALKQLLITPHTGEYSLVEYLTRYDIYKNVMITDDDLVRIARDLGEDSYLNGVDYVELRFGILRHREKNGISLMDLNHWNQMVPGAEKELMLEHFLEKTQMFTTLFDYYEGFAQVKKSYPGFDFDLLVCMEKTYSPELVQFLAEQLVAFKKAEGYFSDENFIARENIQRAANKLMPMKKDQADELINKLYLIRNSITGFDTVGPEWLPDFSGGVKWKFNAESFSSTFHYLQEQKIFDVFTSHAGEAFSTLEEGLAAIENAVDYLGVKRIGHGLALGIKPERLLGTIDKRGNAYDMDRITDLIIQQNRLIDKIIEKDITVEINLSSNLQTGSIENIFKHPAFQLMNRNVNVVIGTDGLTINDTTIADEIVSIATAFGLNDKKIEELLKKIMATVDTLVPRLAEPEPGDYLVPRLLGDFSGHRIRRRDYLHKMLSQAA